ncbi:hypothetical protein OHA91_38365 [Streptomyces erythrochromogenes]|uniref:Uncharacterized protein n=1 Tax=Streptomyces erythrochromogenes TaxID=285574 RepID=A0ABZ1QMQ6_9ACTN|nr:hypothetical protein [Streptomyces erythrochromogenes]
MASTSDPTWSEVRRPGDRRKRGLVVLGGLCIAGLVLWQITERRHM